MDDTIKRTPITSAAHLEAVVYDTEYGSPTRGLARFREAISDMLMPWSFDLAPEGEFSGRIEGWILDAGAVARVKMSPIVAIRGQTELAKSPFECLYANFVLSGELNVKQSGHDVTARRGDLAVYDSSRPVMLTGRNSGLYWNLALRISKAELREIPGGGSLSYNFVISAGRMLRPLSSCLAFLSKNLLTLSADELTGLHRACSLLLPLAATDFESAEVKNNKTISNRHFGALLRYISGNIRDSTLSPLSAATHVGISVRYVHTLFAANGMTFGAYVMNRRLEFVSRDLIVHRQEPIFSLAYQSGFNDLSTFIRAFKKKYGCSPRQFRSRF